MHSSTELLNSILTCSPNGYVACDEFGKITFINSIIEKLTAWNESELIGQETSKLYLLPESFSASESSGDVKPQAAVLLRRDGKRITLRARQTEIKKESTNNSKNSFGGYLTIFYVENLGEADLERAQVEFVSTVSHELRTPLTSIKGFAETLLKSPDKIAEDSKKKYLTIIKEQADRLIRLVEDLLAVSRLETHSCQLAIRALDLSKYVDKVCDSLHTKAANRKIMKRVKDDLPKVWADADKLEQILTNLVDNAIKYSPDGSTVTISASAVQDDKSVKSKIKLEVIDQGIGISETDLKKIFTKFGRLDNPLTRQTQGTGLGLFITKSLILELKGEIDVSSKPGETVFTVVFPAVVPEEVAATRSEGNE